MISLVTSAWSSVLLTTESRVHRGLSTFPFHGLGASKSAILKSPRPWLWQARLRQKRLRQKRLRQKRQS
jgi:hypothetical protein